jgi:hypothetical protein
MKSRFALAAAAALALVVYTLVSRYLPVLGWHTGIVVSALIVTPLMALILVGLWPLRTLGHRLLLVAAAGFVAAALTTHLGWVPASDLAKILIAGSLGFWLAQQIEALWWYVPVAAVAAGVDLFSVFAGPTKVLLAHGPVIVGYFTVAMAWFGYSWHQAYTALGTSDLIFFSLYYEAAERFALRRVPTLVGMTASFVITVAIGFWFSALPALPLLSLGFVAPNADLLWRALRGARRAAVDEG